MFNKNLSKCLWLGALLLLNIAFVQQAIAGDTTYSASQDTFLRNGRPNVNEGGNKKLRVRKAGRNRTLIAFDLSSITPDTQITTAKLRLYVTDNNGKWGNAQVTQNNTVGAHLVGASWTEGNGSNATTKAEKAGDDGTEVDSSKKPKGSGSGATWRCATDTNVGNTRPNCSSRWNGGTFTSTASDTVLITNSTTGFIEFDVTDDVKAIVAGTSTNNGWLIKKEKQDRRGSLWFASREATANTPELVVTTP